MSCVSPAANNADSLTQGHATPADDTKCDQEGQAGTGPAHEFGMGVDFGGFNTMFGLNMGVWFPNNFGFATGFTGPTFDDKKTVAPDSEYALLQANPDTPLYEQSYEVDYSLSTLIKYRTPAWKRLRLQGGLGAALLDGARGQQVFQSRPRTEEETTVCIEDNYLNGGDTDCLGSVTEYYIDESEKLPLGAAGVAEAGVRWSAAEGPLASVGLSVTGRYYFNPGRPEFNGGLVFAGLDFYINQRVGTEVWEYFWE